jgi:hypothetical protein
MTKPFLLMAGHYYEPETGSGCWKEFYETREKAEKDVLIIDTWYWIKDQRYEWYEIKDIREFTK